MTIGIDGWVRNVQIISGHPLLRQAALDAVRQWMFQPTLLNDRPVEVVAEAEVNFSLI